jgi:outer membrane protein OmpA-like peptidoglycan-associated protein
MEVIMQMNTLNPQAAAFSLPNRNTLRAAVIGLALSAALHAVRGHAQDQDTGTTGSDAADHVPTLIMPQQDTERSPSDGVPSSAEPSSAPDQRGTGEQTRTPAATVLFDPGTAELTLEATAILDDVRQKLDSTPDSAILLTGHTDPVEAGAGATVLSQARAVAVGNYLNNAGVPADRIVVRSVADNAPTVDPSGCENLDGEALAHCLAPDRSVEIEVTTSTAEAPSRNDAATSQEGK